MSAIDQLKKLLPSFEQSQLRDVLDKAFTRIHSNLLPQYRKLNELVESTAKFKDEDVIKLDKEFTQFMQDAGLVVKSKRNPTSLDYIILTMENSAPLIEYLKERLKTDVGRSLMTDGITFNKHTLLQIIDCVNYFVDYSTMYLNYVTFKELNSVVDSNIATAKLPPDIDTQLYTTVHTFSVASRVVAMPLSDLRGVYGDIPDVIIDEDSIGDMKAVFGQKIDPLGFSHVPFPFSLIFYARLNIADKQMSDLEETIQTAKTVEYRIAAYQKKIALGGSDAASEKVLELQEKRLADLIYERERLEKKYGLK